MRRFECLDGGSTIPPRVRGGRGSDGQCRVRENPVSLRALNPRERSFPSAAAGRSSSGESESRRRCMRAAGTSAR